MLIQVLATVHLVLVRHVVCPEHGEVMHAGEAHAADRADAGDAGGDDADARVRAARADADPADADDHCQLLTERRDVGPRSAATIDVALAPVAVERPAPLSLPARTRALYRLAPKISPPHAA